MNVNVGNNMNNTYPSILLLPVHHHRPLRYHFSYSSFCSIWTSPDTSPAYRHQDCQNVLISTKSPKTSCIFTFHIAYTKTQIHTSHQYVCSDVHIEQHMTDAALQIQSSGEYRGKVHYRLLKFLLCVNDSVQQINIFLFSGRFLHLIYIPQMRYGGHCVVPSVKPHTCTRNTLVKR